MATSASKKITYTLKAEYEGKGDMKQLSSDLKALNQIEVFEKAQDGFKETNEALVAARQKVRDLRKDMKDPGGEKFADSYKSAQKEVKRLNDSLTRQKSKLDAARQAIRDQHGDVDTLAGKYGQLQSAVDRQAKEMVARQKLQVRSFKEIEGEIADLVRAYRTLENSGTASMQELAVAKQKLRERTSRLNAEMGKTHITMDRGVNTYNRATASLTKMRSVVAPLVTLMAGLSGVQFAKDIWQAGIASEQLDLSFKAIYEDAGKAGAELDWLRGVADELGFDFQTLAESYRGVAASSKGTILEGQKTRQIFLAVSEASRALGLNNEQASGALNAIAQMMSKGKIQAEELRGQLGERLFGAFQLVAESAGVTTAELNEMLERGEVGIDILSGFADVLHKEYGPAAKEASDQAVAAYGRMTTAWFEFKVALAENGFLDSASDGIGRLTEALKDPAVQQAATHLMNSLILIAGWVVRLGAGANGAFMSMKAGLEIAFTGALRAAQGIAVVTDALGITEGAAAKVKKAADEMWESAKSDVSGAVDSYGAMVASYDKIGEAAEKTESVVDQTFQTAAESAEDAAGTMKQVQGEALEAMKKQYQEYADEVARLQEQIVDRERSLQGELREMARSGMSSADAWRDQKAEAEEYMQAAEKAAEAGNFEEALQYADEAKELYKRLNTEVRENERVVVSAQEGLETAMGGVKKAGELGINILKQQQEEANKAMEALTEESGFQNLERGMDESKIKWLNNWREMKSATMQELDDVKRRIDKVVDDRNMTVYVDVVEKRAEGGRVGVLGFASGGSPSQVFRRLASPYITSGSGLGDDVPAMLMKNEFVQPVHAVKRYGLGFMEAIRRGMFPVELARGFRYGGPVSLSLPPLPNIQHFAAGGQVAPAGGGSVDTVNLVLTMPSGESYGPFSGDRAEVRRLQRTQKHMKMGRSG